MARGYLYTFRNRMLNCYQQPYGDYTSPEALISQLRRSVATDPQKLSHLVLCDLYMVGEFDDDKGTITACNPVLIGNCDELLNKLKEVAKEATKDGE